MLAVLENTDLIAAAHDNKGSYEAAQAAYATATKAQVPEDAQKAELDFAQAKANLDLNTSIVNSRKQLFAEGAIPGRDLDTAQAALVQAQAAYDSAAKHLESMKNVSHEAALKSAQGQLTSAEGKYKGAAAQVNYSEIRSPIDGVVTDRPLFAGETSSCRRAPDHRDGYIVAAGQDAHRAESGAADEDRRRCNPPRSRHHGSGRRQGHADQSRARSRQHHGRSLAQDRQQEAGKLKVGTPVKVSITGRTVEKALKIPVSSILTAQDGTKSVMVVGTDGAAHKKAVKLGIQDGDDVQITKGLTTADMVITSGAYGLDEGTKVKVGKAEDDDDAKPAAGKGGDKD